MNNARHLLSMIDKLNDWTGKIVSYFALFMMFTVVYEVIARYLFNRPTIWTMEVNQYVLCGYTALAGGYAMLHRSHVNVEIVYERLSVRLQAFVDLVTSLLFFLFIIVLIWKGWGMASEAWRYAERSETLLAAPLFPSLIVIPIGGVLILLQGISKFIYNLQVLFDRDATQ